MALRKFNKYMKIVTLIVIASFALSAAFAGYSYFSAYLTNKKETLLKFEGHKIYKNEYEKELTALKQQILLKGKIKDVPEEFLKEIALSSVISKESAEVLSENLKVKVSRSDINEKVEEIEKAYGGREKLAVLLAKSGSDLTVLKEEIKSSLLVEKTIEKIKENIKPTDAELETIYNRNKYTLFSGNTMEQAKEQVEDLYYNQKVNLLMNSNLENIILNSNIETEDQELLALFEKLKKKEVEYKDLYILRKDMYQYYFAKMSSEGKYSKDFETKVNEEQTKALEKIFNKFELAKSKGVKVIDGLVPLDAARYGILEYYNQLVDSYNPSEEQMKAWFEKYKSSYDTRNTISGEILGIKFKASEKDLENTENQVKELQKTLTAENFDKVAKEKSEDPGSAENGGDLGWSDIRKYVPEFAEVLKYNKGDIVGPIKTQFGYHLVYVVDKDEKDSNKVHLKHILITPIISEETKTKDINELKEIEANLKDKKITWEEINKNENDKYTKFDIKESFKDISISSSLPLIGYQREFLEKMFSDEVGTITEKDFGNLFMIIQKTGEIPYKSAKYEDFKDRIKLELSFAYAEQQISK